MGGGGGGGGVDVFFCSINFHPFISHEADNVIKVQTKFYKAALKIYFLHRKMHCSRSWLRAKLALSYLSLWTFC